MTDHWQVVINYKIFHKEESPSILSGLHTICHVVFSQKPVQELIQGNDTIPYELTVFFVCADLQWKKGTKRTSITPPPGFCFHVLHSHWQQLVAALTSSHNWVTTLFTLLCLDSGRVQVCSLLDTLCASVMYQQISQIVSLNSSQKLNSYLSDMGLYSATS